MVAPLILILTVVNEDDDFHGEPFLTRNTVSFLPTTISIVFLAIHTEAAGVTLFSKTNFTGDQCDISFPGCKPVCANVLGSILSLKAPTYLCMKFYTTADCKGVPATYISAERVLPYAAPGWRNMSDTPHMKAKAIGDCKQDIGRIWTTIRDHVGFVNKLKEKITTTTTTRHLPEITEPAVCSFPVIRKLPPDAGNLKKRVPDNANCAKCQAVCADMAGKSKSLIVNAKCATLYASKDCTGEAIDYIRDGQKGVVVAQDQDDAEYMMRKLVKEYRKWGLEVSISKSEKMTFGGDQQSIELEDGQQIKGCEHYKYLGVRLTQDGRTDQAIKERNTLARKATAMLNGILWDPRISKENKRRIYDVVVKSTLTYGCEVWQLKERTKGMLRATEMDFWRRSAGISRRDRVRNERVRQIMGVENDIIFDVMTRQLVWYGHVNRMTDERLPKKSLDWVPPGRRRRGRPVKGWRQGILEEMRVCQLPEGL
ncbi:unnamed protein product [Bemisia tabaci]|uniref:Reverse transcriptase domain-containing protein n=1 Tax=Bemisia tabaci TaxID=7038 RepID=A0A9P0ALC8_BEMTA|nr:unnamed protein product [Bemisia tabaci]